MIEIAKHHTFSTISPVSFGYNSNGFMQFPVAIVGHIRQLVVTLQRKDCSIIR